MGKFVVKASPDEDLYMEWSDTISSSLFLGLRKAMQASGIAEERLIRVDTFGTSSYLNKGSWEDDGLIVQKMNPVEWEGD